MRNKYRLFSLIGILFLCWLVCPVFAADKLSTVESGTAAGALEPSNTHARDHIVLVWPKDMAVNWYPESKVKGPEQLADWLEKCYMLSVGWLKIDPNKQLNRNKTSSQRARLVFVHNGMRDYNYGGTLPRPVIGLRDFSGVGSEDWFGWLTHELSHEFFLRFPEVTGTPEDNAWHEALCDYMRYWLLKESGMPQAARNWLGVLQKASPLDYYKGGAYAILNYHKNNACTSPADFWEKIRRNGVAKSFGPAPWLASNREAAFDPKKQMKVALDAEIDGTGSFTFRGNRIYYEHFLWDYPARVKVNDMAWNDLDIPFQLDDTPVFASAEVADMQGRGIVASIPHQDRFVLFVEDPEASSAHYRITIIMDKKTKP